MKHRMFMVLILLLLSAILVAPVAAQDIVTNTPRGDTAAIVTEEPAATEIVTPVPTVVPEADGKLLTEFIAWTKDTTSSALDRFTDMSRWFVVAFILLALVALRAVYTSVPIKYQRQIKQGALDVMDGVELKVSEGVIAARNTPDPADDMYMAGLQLLTDKVDALIKLLPAPPDQPQQGRIHPLFAILLGALLLMGAVGGYISASPLTVKLPLMQNTELHDDDHNNVPDQWQAFNLLPSDGVMCGNKCKFYFSGDTGYRFLVQMIPLEDPIPAGQSVYMKVHVSGDKLTAGSSLFLGLFYARTQVPLPVGTKFSRNYKLRFTPEGDLSALAVAFETNGGGGGYRIKYLSVFTRTPA